MSNSNTAWKVFACGVILVRIFAAFGLNTESPYSVRIGENTDQNNSEYGHFLPSVKERSKVTLNV